MIQDFSDNKGQHKALKKKKQKLWQKNQTGRQLLESNDKSGQLINNTKR